jgi:nitrite reductase (NO-forming)/hydroxylamine reductase
MVAANQSNKIAVSTPRKASSPKLVDVGKIPHPGRGANFVHPKFGPVWATGHLGDEKISLIGTDPSSIQGQRLEGRAALRARAAVPVHQDHPKSTNLYVDTPLNPDPKISQSSPCSTSRTSTSRYKVLPIAEWAGS